MLKIKTILCPTDWSEPSRVALQAAVNMARHEGAQLLLLHVLPPLGLVHGIASVTPLGKVIEDEAREKLAALIAECVPPEVPARPLVRIGEEADEIHRAALKVDVVVMSTHGRAGWSRWAFGSVAETVLGVAPCPIFVIGPAAASGVKSEPGEDGRGSCSDFPLKQVLWPTDWSESSERALREAATIAAHYGTQLLMLHVIEPPQEGEEEEGWSREQHTLAQSRFRALCERTPQVREARSMICLGAPEEEIMRVALAEGADLLVMSAHGRSGWERQSLGSVTQKVLREVICPVLIVPPHALAMSKSEPVAVAPTAL